MERYLREVIGNQLKLNSPLLLIPEFIYLLVKPMFDIFALAMKFDLFIFGQFSKLLLIFDFNFWQSSPPWIYVSKDALNHFLVHSNAKKKQSQKS